MKAEKIHHCTLHTKGCKYLGSLSLSCSPYTVLVLERCHQPIVLALFESILLGAAFPILLNENKGAGD